MALYWNDPNRFHIQTNNPSEGIISKILKRGYLETCGPTAAVNCLDAMGYPLTYKGPGVYEPQPEEILSDAMNDPATQYMRDQARAGVGHIPGNRIPQLYPVMVEHVFGVKGAKFGWLGNDWNYVTSQLENGKTIQLCLKSGHYIAAVHFDSDTGDIIYNDSWPGRPGLKNGGFNERMTQKEFAGNVENFCIVYS